MDDSARASLTAAQKELVERFLAGEPGALARSISLVENQSPGFENLLHALHTGVGRARRIGITGPPGAGKSTLAAALARHFRDRGERIGVIAVDPTSPFTGGALLGDRVRMDALSTEPGIFIRSMGSRGSHGGLAATTREAADLMDAFGFDRVLVETVGVGQSELEVASSADSTLVVLVPESGDGIQAMKAGLMEVGDLFAVNKADRPGAEAMKREVEVALALAADAASDGWEVPVLTCIASQAVGIPELAGRIDDHFRWLEETGRLTERRRRAALEHARVVLERAVQRRALSHWNRWLSETASDAPLEADSPYALGRRLLGEMWEDAARGRSGG